MSHTTYHSLADRPDVWLIHNSDWSGPVIVRWRYIGAAEPYEWTVADGHDLLSGDLMGSPLHSINGQSNPVPYWVVARAVACAVDSWLKSQIVSYVEGL